MPLYIVKTPNNSSDGTAYSPSRKLVRTSTGVLWCCYSGPDGSGIMQIYASYSTDRGVNWTEEQVTDEATDQECPSIAVDSNDDIHIAWKGKENGFDYEIYYRKRTSGSWGSIEPVTSISNIQGAPAIAVDSSRNTHLLWVGRGWGVNTTRRNVQYRMRTSAGSWQAQEQVSDIASNQLSDCGSIAIDSSDVVHAVWSGLGWGTNTGDNNIQYRQRTAGGWQSQEDVTDLATWNHMPCICIDSNDDIHIAWYAETLYGTVWDIFYNCRLSGVWQTAEQLTYKAVDGYDEYQPSLAIDESDNVHIAWYGYGWGSNLINYNIQYLKRLGGVWQSVEGITDRAYDQSFPSLLDGVNNPGIVFIGYEGADLRVEYYSPTIRRWKGNINIDQLYFQHAERMER